MPATRDQYTIETDLGLVTLVTRDDEIYSTTKIFIQQQDPQGICDVFVAECERFADGSWNLRSYQLVEQVIRVFRACAGKVELPDVS